MSGGDLGKVAVMFGGSSAEREISLKSGNAVLAALRRAGVDAHPFDPAERPLEALKEEGYARVFIALHGRGGEDGSLQGALDLMDIPYTGSGVLASALAMDKWRSKLLWQAAGIPVPECVVLTADSDWDEVVKRLGLPIFVKPANEGSSIGITKVKSANDLRAAFHEAAKYDDLVLAERFIDGAEVQFPILGTEVLPSIRIETPHEFYDYDAKYFANDTRYVCPGLSADDENRLTELVRRSFQVLGCRGWARVDLMLDPKGQPYFLEMNTVPGMTDHSLVPMSAKVAGISFEQLVVKVLEMARHG
ncbi:MAG: D-alanine--D-alanine ligase [Gammaproteobacteria bacterium]|nr:D-alanine--D-alanine ligase [Gammaproteobacteria bacterium]MBU1415672.1 D-alanine--D-alanine ligase [Gammaproteobacteria bacterium]